jgi:hypothetical protein
MIWATMNIEYDGGKWMEAWHLFFSKINAGRVLGSKTKCNFYSRYGVINHQHLTICGSTNPFFFTCDDIVPRHNNNHLAAAVL